MALFSQHLISNSPVSALINTPSPFHKGLLILWRLAWKSRLRLSYLIIIAFMILDIHMTLEVRVDVGQDDMEEDPEEEDDDGLDGEPIVEAGMGIINQVDLNVIIL